ncbi:MAG TPA: metalloregulator ArsR/SmtB family transcription factor [Haloplasmataceae bacterium]
MTNKHICDYPFIHQEVVEKVRKELPNDENINDLASFFKVLGDKTRLKIISALLHAEMCVCDISYLLNMSQSLISHQLKVLRDSHFVKYRRQGKVVYYSLDDDHIETIVKYGLLHINESGERDEAK